MIVRPFPEEHTVPSLQLICASQFDTKMLDSLNLAHLHLPPPHYALPGPEIVLLCDSKRIMYINDYNNFCAIYTNMLRTKTIGYFSLHKVNELIKIIEPASLSKRYKKYLCERVDCSLDKKIYLPLNKDYVVLDESDLLKISEFIKNLISIINIIQQIAEIVAQAPFMHKKIIREYVDKFKTIDFKIYIDYFYMVVDRLCYENSLVTKHLIINNIMPHTLSTIIYTMAPKQFMSFEPDVKQDMNFTRDLYLPCKCFRNKDLVVLRAATEF